MIEEISYEEVRNIAMQIKSSADRVQEILNRVDQEMSGKIGSGEVWSSQASRSFYQTFKELSARFESFYQELVRYSQFLNSTVTAYEENDARIAASAGQ